MRKALLAALTFIVVGCMMVNGTLATVLNEAQDIFQNLTAILGAGLGFATTDSTFDVDLISIGEVEQLYPGGSATHTVAVKNAGSLNAYFRLAFAVQYDAETWPLLDIDFTFDQASLKAEGSWRDITVGGTPYKMMVFTYDAALPVGAQSPAVSITIAMDKHITSTQLSRYRADFLKTQVLAIDPTPFLAAKDANNALIYPTPESALDAALPLDHFNPF